MGAATILGTSYQTVRMPDGKVWTAKNLEYTDGGIGWWWGAGASNDGDGRYYNLAQAETINGLLSQGWRVPTKADLEAWRDALFLAHTQNLAAGAVKSASGWSAPNTGAVDTYGFAMRGSGRYTASGGTWDNKGLYAWIGGSSDALLWVSPQVSYDSAAMGSNVTGPNVSNRYPLRLVRDYSEFPAEAHETTHALSIEWTEAADGTPIAYDDGAEYDYIESTITARLTPAQLSTLEAAWQSATKIYTIDSTGYLLGPLVDMSAGVEVRLMSYQVDQSADSSMSLYDVTIGVHYGPLSAPSAGSLAVVQERGRPYHSVAPGAAAWITEGGSSDVNAYGRASERSCTWYTHSLTTAQAADVVNALRTLRGSSTTWTAGGVATPWGPSESGTATVWIPSWSVHRESNLLWGVQMELVRNG